MWCYHTVKNIFLSSHKLSGPLPYQACGMHMYLQFSGLIHYN